MSGTHPYPWMDLLVIPRLPSLLATSTSLFRRRRSGADDRHVDRSNVVVLVSGACRSFLPLAAQLQVDGGASDLHGSDGGDFVPPPPLFEVALRVCDLHVHR